MLVTMSCYETGRKQNSPCFGLSLGKTHTVCHSRAVLMNRQLPARGQISFKTSKESLLHWLCICCSLSLSHKPPLGRESSSCLILAD